MRLLLLLVLVVTVQGVAAQAPPIRVDSATIPWVPGLAVPHAAFVRLTNTSEQPLRLTGARSNDFARIEFQQPSDSGLKMWDTLPMPRTIEPDDTFAFRSGGPRMMLFVQSHRLEPGDTAEIAFEFEGFDALPVTFTVRKETPY